MLSLGSEDQLEHRIRDRVSSEWDQDSDIGKVIKISLF